MCLIVIISLKPPNQSERETMNSSMLHMRNQGSERVSDLPQVSQLRLCGATSDPEHGVAVSVDSSQQSDYKRKEGKPGCMVSWRQGLEQGFYEQISKQRGSSCGGESAQPHGQ